ncbi:hypothetical protein ColTof4_07366 [Colletotrichum tofieldiae]|nr:hypothetical protein ColTof3_12312 [Colletotrichum tofieldiae]GKT74943.1 hypothetical protein ColTof4_07366 [Colletotrichum tofieldiae]GKT92156.1 hypothetical protein Ct61P_10006 [Colletotrichum tofieldiae]
MVKLTLLVTAALATTSLAFDWSWSKCLNADRCVERKIMGSSELYSSGAVDFIYDGSNGYWYAHKLTGVFLSPAGYFQTAHDRKILDVWHKDNSVPESSWQSSGSACCLPDQAGTNVANLRAFSG